MTANQIRLLIALARKFVEQNGGKDASEEMLSLWQLADTVRDEHNEYAKAMNEFDKLLGDVK